MGRKSIVKDFIMEYLEGEEATLSKKRFYPVVKLASIRSSRVYAVAKEMLKDGTIYCEAGPASKTGLKLKVYVSLNDIELPPQKWERHDPINIDKDGRVQPNSEMDKLIEEALASSER